jgi:hypothetical protein
MNSNELVSVNILTGEKSIIVKRVPYGKSDTSEHLREYRSIYGGGVGNKADWLAIGAEAKVNFVTFIEKDGKNQDFYIDGGGEVKTGKAEAKVKVSKSKDEAFAELYAKADAAGIAAGEAAIPTPMALSGGPGNQPPKHYYISEGACGFAWVKIRPANSPFGNWLKKYKGERVAYNGGIDIWCNHFNQSIARKEAWAEAFAKVLNDNGIEHAYADSRLD